MADYGCPYQIHLVTLNHGVEAANSLYATLESNGFEVLYDDREESPGVKFNDADLIGIPLRLTVSGRSLKEGSVELKLRRETQLTIIPAAEVLQRVKTQISILQVEIANKVMKVAYNA